MVSGDVLLTIPEVEAKAGEPLKFTGQPAKPTR